MSKYAGSPTRATFPSCTAVLVLSLITVPFAAAQNQPSDAKQQSTSKATPTTPVKKKRTSRSVARPSSLKVIPMETAPPTPPAAAATAAQQKAADERLLQQQQMQSAHAAEINNQQVQQAQRQQQQVQSETRIQDAPGPVQTGVVPPSGGPPVAPVNEQRIQDAPGPAQTLPPPVQPPMQPQPQQQQSSPQVPPRS